MAQFIDTLTTWLFQYIVVWMLLGAGVFFTLRLWRTGEAAAALLAIGSYGIAASTKFSVMGTAATGGVLAVLGCVLGRAPRGTP